MIGKANCLGPVPIHNGPVSHYHLADYFEVVNDFMWNKKIFCNIWICLSSSVYEPGCFSSWSLFFVKKIICFWASRFFQVECWKQLCGVSSSSPSSQFPLYFIPVKFLFYYFLIKCIFCSLEFWVHSLNNSHWFGFGSLT